MAIIYFKDNTYESESILQYHTFHFITKFVLKSKELKEKVVVFH